MISHPQTANSDKVIEVLYGHGAGYIPMASQLSKIHIGPEYIGHALRDKHLFVPINQRDFSWKDEHVRDLYDDIGLAIGQHAEEYFLGSIVVIPEQGTGRLMVVDGQQRLATSLVLLAAIRDFFDTIKPEEARKFERAYVLDTPYKATAPVPHLVLNEKDHSYFFKRVLLPFDNPERKAIEAQKKASLRPSHQRINKAATLAKEKVDFITKQHKKTQFQIEALDQWVTFLDKSAHVIWVTVPDESAAYVIFETMNDRGLELSATDLIKNYLLGRAGSTRIEQVKTNWNAMTGALETIAEAEIVRTFVRQYWISQYGVVRTAEFFNALKEKKQSELEVVSFSDELVAATGRYVPLLNSTHAFWNEYPQEARKAVATLDILGLVQTRPLLLSVIDKFSTSEVTQVLTAMVSWAVRLLISGKQGSGALETVYGTTAKEVTEGKLTTAAAVRKQVLPNIPNDEQFKLDFAGARVSKVDVARYYLRAMESTVRGEAGAYLSPNDANTLEHVIPEKRTQDWNHLSQEEHDEFFSRIGNLALLMPGANSKLSSKGFAIKKPEYAKVTDLQLTKTLADYSTWGAAEVEVRQSKLAEIAVKTWPI
jgi:Protein of unknown function DUF262/Protein of unknown function (DUF1524)